MRYLLSFVCFLLTGLLVVFSPDSVMASTYGKVQGVVADADGNPLPGANVVIEGTRRGATTDAEGYYLILAVDPGLVRVTASMVGYVTSTQEEVSVQSDFTTRLNFTMTEATLEAAEMVVTARRPPVEPDKTTSRYVVDIFDIQSVPLARDTDDLLELQPGVSVDGNVRLRGSDTAETNSAPQQYYEVDGVKMLNDDTYLDYEQWIPLNKGALQEVVVTVGGMDAEYGGASGGVISMVTRESGSRFGGQVEYRLEPPGVKHFGPNIYDSGWLKRYIGLANPWSDSDFTSSHSRTDYDEKTGHWIEGSVHGPLSDNAGFFVNAKTDRTAPVTPNANMGPPDNFSGMGSFTFRSGGTMKFKLGGIYSTRDQYDGDQLGYFRRGPFIGKRFYFGGGTNATDASAMFLPEGFASHGVHTFKESAAYLAATHTISPTTFYDIRVSWQNSRTTTDVAAAEGSSESRSRDSYGFTEQYSVYALMDHDRKRISLKADVTSQVAKQILAKAGLEAYRYDLLAFEYHDLRPGGTERRIRMAGKGNIYDGWESFNPKQVGGYVQTKMEFEGLVINAGLRADALHAGDIWVQDGMQWWHWWRMRRFENVPFRSTDWITNVSPRLGISHPITERSTIRFYSGVLHEMPSKQFLYDRGFRSRTVDTDVNGNGQIDQTELGNSLEQPHNQRYATTDLDPQRTVTFEAGVDWNFAGDYVLSSTAYFKDLEGQIMQRRYYWAADVTLWPDGVTKDNSFRSGNISTVKTSRGFELSFKKMFSQMTSFNLSWNTQWLKAGQGTWTVQFFHPSSFVDSNEFFLGVDSNSDGTETPKVPTAAERADYKARAQANFDAVLARVGADNGPAGYVLQPMRVEGYDQTYADHRNVYRLPKPTNGIDRRNYAALQFLFSAPADYKMKALAGSRVTMLYRIQGGTPYNYTPPDAPTQLRNAPINTVTDLNVEKDFSFGQSGTATAFVEIRNLFNQKDELPTTSNYVLYGLSAFEPDDANFLKYGDYRDMTRYSLGQAESYGAPTGGGVGEQPRLFVLGARLSF